MRSEAIAACKGVLRYILIRMIFTRRCVKGWMQQEQKECKRAAAAAAGESWAAGAPSERSALLSYPVLSSGVLQVVCEVRNSGGERVVGKQTVVSRGEGGGACPLGRKHASRHLQQGGRERGETRVSGPGGAWSVAQGSCKGRRSGGGSPKRE